MAGRTSLLEQKRIQWAKEREEMARFGGSWGLLKQANDIRTTIRTYPVGTRLSLAEMKDKQAPSKPFRATGHYGSTVSLKSLATESSGNSTTSLKCLDYTGGSLINLHDQTEVSQVRRRSPSLPPIYNKDQQQYICQDQQRDFGVEALRYHSQKLQRQEDHRRSYEQIKDQTKNHYNSQGEEREGETSGYASDSVDMPVAATGTLLPGCKPPGVEMTEKTWQNPYYTTPESSLPPSRRLSDGRIGELNRPRWGSVWGQETVRGAPPPSWLSRLGHSSQVLVINHDSASSSDSSTTGSTGSDTNKTYLRGQNIPVDADILHERETRRQKALELQTAIKQQLEERDKQRKEEKERRLREERLEEERILREREREKERFEEEQRRIREKEAAKIKQAEAMREVLQAAERLAKEEKKIRRKRDDTDEEGALNTSRNCEIKIPADNRNNQSYPSARIQNPDRIQNPTSDKEIINQNENVVNHKEMLDELEKQEETAKELKQVQVPISKDVAIVLSGRLEDSEILNKANLQLVNFVLTPSPRKFETATNNLCFGLNTIVRSLGSPRVVNNNCSIISAPIMESRLLTPSKYRATNGRDFGTQTDVESDIQDLREKMEESRTKNASIKERKDATNANRRDEKSTNVGVEEISLKVLPRSKSQPRTSLDSRPRWNANRPGTRYRTQSEKDPHYQRRLRLRRRQIESSDERSRSPSPDRRKLPSIKSKSRTTNRRKLKVDSYDADLSMDSLNSIVPLRTDQNGRINIEDVKHEKCRSDNDHINEAVHVNISKNDNPNIWCGQEILSKLSSLRNVCTRTIY